MKARVHVAAVRPAKANNVVESCRADRQKNTGDIIPEKTPDSSEGMGMKRKETVRSRGHHAAAV